MPKQNTTVFVSYSHADASLVTPVVKLLRVNKSLVFQDTDSIPPGKRWREEIAKALAESNLVVVFWCNHAFQSNEVSTEWRTAIEQDKEVLPLLLDATPLPPELGNFQWIDFRETVGVNHSEIRSNLHGAPQAKKMKRPWVWYTIVGILVVAVVVLIIFPMTFSDHMSPPPSIPGESHSTDDSFPNWILLLFGASGLFLLWLLRRRRYHKRLSQTLESYSEETKRQMVVKLEAEILRRTVSEKDGGT